MSPAYDRLITPTRTVKVIVAISAPVTLLQRMGIGEPLFMTCAGVLPLTVACFLWWHHTAVRGWLLAGAGAAMNAAVMLLNGGRMPAHGIEEPVLAWTPVTDATRLSLLADRLTWGGASAGDALIVGGLVLVIAELGWRRLSGIWEPTR